MKSNILAILIFLATFTFPSFGQSGGDGSTIDYLKLEAGYISGDKGSASEGGITVEAEIDSYTNFGIGFGSYIGEGMRIELLGNYLQPGDWNLTATDGITTTSFEVSDDYILSLFFNVYRDFMTSERFRPYIGGGLGLSHMNLAVSLGDVTIEESESGLGVNGSAGVCVVLSDNACLEFGYRANYFSFDSSDGITHEGRVGVRLSGF